MSLRSEWTIPQDVTYLNHGSFGPSPRVVQEAREEWSRRLESRPMDFFYNRMEPALDEAMASVARFVAADPRDMAFVENATVAMNAVAESIELKPGDEVLLTDHEYGAVFRIWRHKCDQVGARLITARLAGESEDKNSKISPVMTVPEEIVKSIFRAVADRTKIIVVSHVTSPTAVIFPVAEICRQAHSVGIPVCVDGPHAIAMLPVDLKEIDCDFYCASLHKWLSAPFGSGFLYVKRKHQHAIRPHLTSWGRSLGGRSARWQDVFNWLGTRDPAPFLTTPVAIEFLERVGVDAFRKSTHEMAQTARKKLEDLFETKAWIPDSPEWYGSMVAVPLPESGHKKPRPNAMHPLQQELLERFRIEVPVTESRGQFLLRVSFHLYNSIDEIDALVDGVKALRGKY